MDVREPHVRRRGFFLHSADTGDPDNGEHEDPEGFVVRLRVAKASVDWRYCGTLALTLAI